MSTICPCGCGQALIGRQKAASPACRKRLERARKAPARGYETAIPAVEPEPETQSVTEIRHTFEDSPFRWPVERRDFSALDFDPHKDLTLQPAFCLECGEPYERHSAFLTCRKGHSRGIECVGCADHPFNPEWEAYLDLNGREAHVQACERRWQRRKRELGYA